MSGIDAIALADQLIRAGEFDVGADPALDGPGQVLYLFGK